MIKKVVAAVVVTIPAALVIPLTANPASAQRVFCSTGVLNSDLMPGLPRGVKARVTLYDSDRATDGGPWADFNSDHLYRADGAVDTAATPNVDASAIKVRMTMTNGYTGGALVNGDDREGPGYLPVTTDWVRPDETWLINGGPFRDGTTIRKVSARIIVIGKSGNIYQAVIERNCVAYGGEGTADGSK